ncbi:hypothetical protein PAMP_000880 [Pampus punctatissimus]
MIKVGDRQHSHLKPELTETTLSPDKILLIFSLFIIKAQTINNHRASGSISNPNMVVKTNIYCLRRGTEMAAGFGRRKTNMIKIQSMPGGASTGVSDVSCSVSVENQRSLFSFKQKQHNKATED